MSQEKSSSGSLARSADITVATGVRRGKGSCLGGRAQYRSKPRRRRGRLRSRKWRPRRLEWRQGHRLLSQAAPDRILYASKVSIFTRQRGWRLIHAPARLAVDSRASEAGGCSSLVRTDTSRITCESQRVVACTSRLPPKTSDKRIMINPVSSLSASLAPSFQPAAKAQPQAATPQDTVNVSPNALAAAGGDADHDGDSH